VGGGGVDRVGGRPGVPGVKLRGMTPARSKEVRGLWIVGRPPPMRLCRDSGGRGEQRLGGELHAPFGAPGSRPARPGREVGREARRTQQLLCPRVAKKSAVPITTTDRSYRMVHRTSATQQQARKRESAGHKTDRARQSGGEH